MIQHLKLNIILIRMVTSYKRCINMCVCQVTVEKICRIIKPNKRDKHMYN